MVNETKRVAPEPRPAPRTTAIELAAVGLLLLVLAVALQWRLGAYHAEFSDDDASDYVSALLIHDWLRHLAPAWPIAWVREYHAHYPIVGIGHWGPLYYAVAAVWMLLFSPARESVLLLSAAVTLATSLITYVLAARAGGRLMGLFAALVLVASPIVQEGTSQMMLDMPVALTCLLAAWCYAAYLCRPRLAPAIGFGLLAACALLIKGNGACLALVPPFAVLLGRRFDLLRRIDFWLPAAIVVALAGPWYALTYDLVAAGFRFGWGWTYTRIAFDSNAEIMWRALGPLLLVAGIAGFVAVVVARRDNRSAMLTACAALAAAVWTFQCVVPAAIQDRYVAPLVAPMLVLAAHAVRCAAAAIAWRRRMIEGALLAALAISFLPHIGMIAPRPALGLIAAAREAWAQYDPANPSILIATHGVGETAAIAELAMADPNRPSLFAVRASRLLGAGGYNTGDYVARYGSADEVLAAIDRYAIPSMLLRSDGLPSEWAHLRQIVEARAEHPGRFQLVWQDNSASPPVQLYRILGNDGRAGDPAALRALSAPRALDLGQ